MTEDQQRLRWGRILVITLVGLAFTAAPFYLANRVNPRFGDEPVIVSTTLTNIGTSIVLVGIVFFLERGLVKRVSDAAASSTARVVEERTSELTTANQALATQLADLRAEFKRASATESAEQTAPLRNVTTDVSFDSVAEALETANDFGALQGGNIVVPLKTPADAPELVSFDWRYHELRGLDGRGTDEYPAVSVNYLATRNPGGGPGTPVVEVLWQPTETPTALLLKLAKEMTRLGFGREAKLVDPDLLEHVGIALSEAVAGRRAEDGAWVEGRMNEWLADGWAVTDEGLISRDHGRIPARDFPQTMGVRRPTVFNPPAPAGVSKEFWEFAVRRAHCAHGHGPVSLAAVAHARSRNPPSFTSETSPRKHPG